MASYSISEINNIIKGELIGNTTLSIESPEEIQKAINIGSDYPVVKEVYEKYQELD